MSNRKPKLQALLQQFDASPSKDSFREILAFEKAYLRTTISGSEADLYSAVQSSHNCMETLVLPPNTDVRLCVVVSEVKEVKVKKGKAAGQLMCFLRAGDYSYILENLVVFSELYAASKSLLYEGSVVLVCGKTSANGGIIVEKIQKI